jgi:hypothetical protein
MKVLITGSTAQQCSTRTASRTPTFSSLVAKGLHDSGVDVDVSIMEPSVYMTKEEVKGYDAVLVGVAPPTSLSANKMYPAFSIAAKALEIGNLILFIDAPEPHKIQSSLKSCYLNNSDLQKDFYKRRKSYSHLLEDKNFRDEVQGFISYLYTEKWPTTLYPAFPWTVGKTSVKSIEGLDTTNFFPVFVDSYLIQSERPTREFHLTKEYWTCDSMKTQWASDVIPTLSYDVIPTRLTRWESEEDTIERIKRSVGTLISTHRSGEPWWSPALAQSISAGIPVVTDWRNTSYLGSEWGYLGSSIEEMSDEERFAVAEAQKSLYQKSLPSWEESVENLLHLFSLNKLSV